MTDDNVDLTTTVIDDAEDIRDPAVREEPRKNPQLLFENTSPDHTVAALRDILAGAGELYDRGVPVRLAFNQIQAGTVAQVMTPDALVLKAHMVCRPYVVNKDKDGAIVEIDTRLPRFVCSMISQEKPHDSFRHPHR